MNFITEKRKAYKCITSRIVTKQAKNIAMKLRITDMYFTWGWFTKFLNRNKFALREPTTKIQNLLRVLLIVADEFIGKFKAYLENRNIIYLRLKIN